MGVVELAIHWGKDRRFIRIKVGFSTRVDSRCVTPTLLLHLAAGQEQKADL